MKLTMIGNYPIPLKDVEISYSGIFDPPKNVAALAAKGFEVAKGRNPNVFDGQLVRLLDIQHNASKCIFVSEKTSYSIYTETRSPTSPFVYKSNPLGMSVLVITADGEICISKRSTKTDQNPGAAYFFGGYVDAPQTGLQVDFFLEVCRELSEEIDIDCIEIDRTFLLGVGYDPLFNHPEAVVITYTSLSAVEVHHRWQSARDRDETEDVVFLPLSQFSLPAAKSTFRQKFSGETPITWSFLTGQGMYREAIIKGFGSSKS